MKELTDEALLKEVLTCDYHGREVKEAALKEILRRGSLQAARAIASNSITISCTAKTIEHNMVQIFLPKEARTFGHCQ